MRFIKGLCAHVDTAYAERWTFDLQERTDLSRLLIAAEICVAAVRGIIVGDVIGRGFDAIDGQDLRAWPERHGGEPFALDSGPPRAACEAIFADVANC